MRCLREQLTLYILLLSQVNSRWVPIFTIMIQYAFMLLRDLLSNYQLHHPKQLLGYSSRLKYQIICDFQNLIDEVMYSLYNYRQTNLVTLLYNRTSNILILQSQPYKASNNRQYLSLCLMLELCTIGFVISTQILIEIVLQHGACELFYILIDIIKNLLLKDARLLFYLITIPCSQRGNQVLLQHRLIIVIV